MRLRPKARCSRPAQGAPLELRGDAEQQVLAAEARHELHAHRQPVRRPVQRQRDRRMAGDVEGLREGQVRRHAIEQRERIVERPVEVVEQRRRLGHGGRHQQVEAAREPGRHAHGPGLLRGRGLEVLLGAHARPVRVGDRPQVRLDVRLDHGPAEHAAELAQAEPILDGPEHEALPGALLFEERLGPGGLDARGRAPRAAARRLRPRPRPRGARCRPASSVSRPTRSAPGSAPTSVAEGPRRRRQPVEVARLVAVHGVEQRGGVAHALRDGEADQRAPDRGGLERDAPARGLEPDQPAPRRGDADRAGAVVRVRERHDARRHGHRRAARRAARRAQQAPRDCASARRRAAAWWTGARTRASSRWRSAPARPAGSGARGRSRRAPCSRSRAARGCRRSRAGRRSRRRGPSSGRARPRRARPASTSRSSASACSKSGAASAPSVGSRRSSRAIAAATSSPRPTSPRRTAAACAVASSAARSVHRAPSLRAGGPVLRAARRRAARRPAATSRGRRRRPRRTACHSVASGR